MSWTWRKPRLHMEPQMSRPTVDLVAENNALREELAGVDEALKSIRARHTDSRAWRERFEAAQRLVSQHEATIATLNGIIQRELSGRHEEPEDAS